MAETSTIFGFMKYVSATDILSDFKKTVDSHFVNSLRQDFFLSFFNKQSEFDFRCRLINCNNFPSAFELVHFSMYHTLKNRRTILFFY